MPPNAVEQHVRAPQHLAAVVVLLLASLSSARAGAEGPSARAGDRAAGTLLWLGPALQDQSGRHNEQDARIANVQGHGSTRVRVQGLVQQQDGAGNRQLLTLGNVVGPGRVAVTTGTLQQHQSGLGNVQTAAIANSSGGARIDLQLGSLQQFQSGQSNRQELELANSSGGETRVRVDQVWMHQAGVQGRQQVRIGNNGGNGALDVRVGPVLQLGPGAVHIGNVDHDAH